jgi:hypothetical protein
MEKKIFLPIWFVLQTTLIISVASGQTPVRGRVTDEKKRPVAYASVYITGSMDGATTDSLGAFLFTTALKGRQMLAVSAVGYPEVDLPFEPGSADSLQLILKPEPKQLGEVVVTAGTMEATNDRILALIKPVDILSNASSQGDLVGAFQNLPGVQRNGGDQTGLFVRGGDASETAIELDGLTVQNPFFSSVPGIGQRSRFNPFQIKGMSFSTGGYSARFGQALSSVLDLETTDLPEKTTTSLAANIIGLWFSHAERLGNNGLECNATYTNFRPLYSIGNTNYDFYDPPQSAGLTTRWISKTGDKGLLKVAVEYNHSTSGSLVPNPNDPVSLVRWDLRNDIVSFHGSYRYRFSDRVKLLVASGYSYNDDHIRWNDTPFLRGDHRVQARAELTWQPDPHFRWLTGGEVQAYGYRQQYDTSSGAFTEVMVAGFTEAEYRPLRWLAIKPGVRAEHSELLSRGDIAPRIALAIKPGYYGQFGLAGGLFYQPPPTLYLLAGYRPGFQQAVHYILNYEWIQNDRSFRIETYYKSYQQLVRDLGVPYNPNPYLFPTGTVDNSGHGYARGIDLFWRDKVSLRPLDLWFTYSYVDTRRLYLNYPVEAMPDYVSNNNLNLIVKFYTDRLPIVASAGYNYASGRPYYNPLAHSFLEDRSPAYENLSFKFSYMHTFGRLFSVFYVNTDDLTNYKNVLGYRYSTDGSQRSPILPPQYFAIYFGIYLSLSAFKKDEL